MLENKKFIYIFLFGALAAIGFAPFNFFPATIISVCALFLFLEKSMNKKTAFWLGFCYGFGYFLAGIYWIAISLLVDAPKFAWLIPFALTLIPAVLALYFAFLAFIYQKFRFESHSKNIVFFAILWVIFEILRSNLFTGFAWNLLGYSLFFSHYLVQSANVFGIYGLSFLAVIFSLTIVSFANKTKGGRVFSSLLILSFAINFSYGYCYIYYKNLYVKDEKIRIVQGNIKQDLKWDNYQKYQNLLKHIAISNAKNKDDIKVVLWPETAVPYPIFDDNYELLAKIKEALPKNGFLITGALRLTLNDEKDRVKNAYNSIFAISNDELKYYDKHHLVPFGEYVPLQKFLPFIDKITDGAVGFSKGEGAKTVEMQGLKFSPLSCYEVIFPNEIIDKNNRPDILINTTNDAWFGNSSGPYQHFNMTRMRAIEYGISLARAANTGISAYIDPFGRVISSIALNETGFIDVKMIEKLPETPFSKFGNLMVLMLFLPFLSVFLVKNGQKD
jgi:apolipoprotein N-acyltransferase